MLFCEKLLSVLRVELPANTFIMTTKDTVPIETLSKNYSKC